MVLTLVIPLRAVYHMEDFITARHLDLMAQVMLATGLIVAYGYMMELLMAWYSGNQIEWFTQMNRMFGPYAWVFWAWWRATWRRRKPFGSRGCAPMFQCCLCCP